MLSHHQYFHTVNRLILTTTQSASTMQPSVAFALLLTPYVRGFSTAASSSYRFTPISKYRTARRYRPRSSSSSSSSSSSLSSVSLPSTTTTTHGALFCQSYHQPIPNSSRSTLSSSVKTFSFGYTPITSKTIRFYNTRETTNRHVRTTTTLAASRNQVLDTKVTSENNHENDVVLLPYEEGSHNSVKIIIPEKDDDNDNDNDNDNNNSPEATFRHSLDATIVACRQLDKSSLWIEVPMSNARFIEAMADIDGLEFHHAEGTIAHLCLWLKDDMECKVPDYGTHQVGVGAIIVNSRNEILCVRGHGRNFRRWNIPGGLAELGERLDDAIVREVMEETGIAAEFQSVLAFRHSHGMQFNRSDLFFVCELRVMEYGEQQRDGDNNGVRGKVNIPEPVAQVEEIAETAWVPLEEYMEVINAGTGHRMMQKVMKLRMEKRRIQQSTMSSIVPGKKPSPIYHISDDDSHS